MDNIEEDKSGEEVTEDVGDTLGENKGEEGRGGETTRSEEGNVDRTEGTAEGSEETVEVKAGNKPGKEGDAEEQITEESNGFKQEKADSALDSGGKEDSTKDGPEKSEEKGLEKDVDNTSKTGPGTLLPPMDQSTPRPSTGNITDTETQAERKGVTELSVNGKSSLTGRRIILQSKTVISRGLTVVDMSGQGLTIIAGSLFSRRTIGALDLSSNNIRVVPPDIRRLINLTHLDISKNSVRCHHPHDFVGLPAALSQLPGLEVSTVWQGINLQLHVLNTVRMGSRKRLG
ncbi:hypothetical protein NP493_1259g00011 [Ridgeia piscesae]|uniref:Uncharacterized protein n=1 Tax=Ridgeia piscesae TaxID=27915 RepID=A0AAD9KAQ5_RIDPI|nr:hypothetical protein NP493_1259g00011 [Ridgeia piscesae]